MANLIGDKRFVKKKLDGFEETCLQGWPVNGEHFWSRGYAASTVGFEENKIRDHIRHQERLDDDEDAGRFQK